MPKRRATVLGVPLDWGASKRGASGGPAALRRANAVPVLESLGISVDDAGDIPVPASRVVAAARLRHASAILAVCRVLEKKVHDAVLASSIPIALGGDHSLAMGSVSGTARAWGEQGKKIGMIYVDAHADINTPETSKSGNLHGMPLAHLVGLGDPRFSRLGGFAPKAEARNVCLLGVRDVDKAEAGNLRRSGIRVFSMMEIDRFGMGAIIEQAIDIASEDTAGFHLSFDIDVVDPGSAPGTGVPKRGGLTYREAHLLMELVADSERLLGLDMVEVNPLEDTHNATAELAVELISSALGKSIY